MSTIGERIKQRRIDLGLTQEELAHRLGNKSRASVCTVEKDKEDLTSTRINQYAKALNCSVLYLMGYEDINGNALENQERYVVKPQITDYRTDFVEAAIEVYRDIQGLSPDRRKALEEYLQFLKSQS